MKKKKLGTKMLLYILPTIIIAMGILTAISADSSRTLVEEQIAEHMSSELNAQNNQIESYLEQIRSTADNISCMLGNTYQSVDIDKYIATLDDIALSNDMIYGCGIWFEPNVYNAEEKYVGPYVYKDGSKTITTYEYSNASYNYFQQEYYTIAKSSKSAVLTDPYYDATSGVIMASCTAPFFDSSNKFMGCVTVDINLDTIQKIVDSISVGENGVGMMVTGEGVFLGDKDKSKVEGGKSIKEDANASLAEAGGKFLNEASGMTTYVKDGKKFNLYYDTVSLTGWKLVIEMPQSELQKPIIALIVKLAFVALVAVICAILVVVIQVRRISKRLGRVQVFANSLAEGDFTVEPIKITAQDELGMMGIALNGMYDSNKDVISNIANKADEINVSSEKLSEAANHLLVEFENIETYMSEVNGDMMQASAATEEVNASVEEVNASVNVLAEQTQASTDISVEIKKRARKISETSQDSYDNAIVLSKSYEEKLMVSMENAKVVENIGTLAGIISEIAEQINLLSLNASIEAARAGEQGRGFAVVASEIGQLASQTAKAVEEIQKTVSDVSDAFAGLTNDSRAMLEFVTDTVTPDYNEFVHVAKQYGEDALTIEETSGKIYEMATNIRSIMNEVSEAIQNIAETSQNTADNSGKILTSVNEVAGVVDSVSSMAGSQEEIAGNLNGVVGNFKL